MIYTTHRESRDLDDKAYSERPIDLSDFQLWLRLDGLNFEEDGPSDDESGFVWPISLSTCETNGWAIIATIGDPRLACDDTWEDRVIGVGKTVAEAMDQAELWAADKPRKRPYQVTH